MKLSDAQQLVLLAALAEYVNNSRAKARILRESGSVAHADRRDEAASEAEAILRLVGEGEGVEVLP